ncbi:hypothetical protein BH20ACT15_BH20ACT15_04670 [soil metagenome]
MSRLPVSGHTLRLLLGGLAVVVFFVFRDHLPEFNLEKVIEDLS